MQFFVDTADVEAIQAASATGLLDGVTTNPSLINKSGRDFKDVIAEICAIVAGPVSAEVTSSNYDEMITQGEYLANIASNVVVKLPLTMAGLKACAHFKRKGINTNVTLCFSPNQALLAAKAGATYVSPFVGRLDDINLDGMALIRNIRTIYANYDFVTKILAASIRTPNHVTEAALAGADIATMPPDVIKKLSEHPLTTTGLAQFEADWKKTGQSFG